MDLNCLNNRPSVGHVQRQRTSAGDKHQYGASTHKPLLAVSTQSLQETERNTVEASSLNQQDNPDVLTLSHAQPFPKVSVNQEKFSSVQPTAPSTHEVTQWRDCQRKQIVTLRIENAPSHMLWDCRNPWQKINCQHSNNCMFRIPTCLHFQRPNDRFKKALRIYKN